MRELTLSEIVSAVGGDLRHGDENIRIKEIVTDSRNVKDGALFIAVIGDTNDGHDYIESAVKNGAAAVMVMKEADCAAALIHVPDTVKAYGDIARYYKEKYNVPTVAITGSVGKTTTKDMIYSAIAADRRALKTEKNYNNHIGVPFTVLNLDEGHKTAVIEMGMNHFGEIDYLASIVKPDIAVITNIGMSHIANLGSREGIFRAKTEITDYFDGHNTLIVNGDDEFLGTLKSVGTLKCKTVYYGVKNPENDITAYDIEERGLDGSSFKTRLCGKEYKIDADIPGVHNVYNALAALCVARELGIKPETAIYGIEHTELTEGRLEVIDARGMKIIKDFYNASPDSVRSALKILACAKEKRKAAVLGDILEMGSYAADAHYELGKEVVKNGIDLLITAGENAALIARGAADAGMKDVFEFKNTEDAAEFAKTALIAGDAVLIKASHGMCFEKVFDAVAKE